MDLPSITAAPCIPHAFTLHSHMMPPDITQNVSVAGWLHPHRAVMLDPYMGGRTMAVAAEKAGRGYIGVDINPKYRDAAQKRPEGVSP